MKASQRIQFVLALALPLALSWTIYTEQLTPGNILLGYGFSVLVVLATGARGEGLRLKDLPRQVYNLILYILYLAFEVTVAGFQVARIILFGLKIEPGTAEVPTLDDSGNDLIAAISAHGITITPGELVVDFIEQEGAGAKSVKMIVHSLNLQENAEEILEADQRTRLNRINKILGYEND